MAPSPSVARMGKPRVHPTKNIAVVAQAATKVKAVITVAAKMVGRNRMEGVIRNHINLNPQ